MGTMLVVVGTKRVELHLKVRDRARRRLLSEVALHGLVEALDLAAGLRVLRGRVDRAGPQTHALGRSEDRAAARGADEDCAVVGEHCGWQAVASRRRGADACDVAGL